MTTTTTAAQPLDLDKLEALARAATPGPWGATKEYANRWRIDVDPAKYQPLAEVHSGVADEACNQGQADADFIAAANPQTVLALITQARAARPVDEAFSDSWKVVIGAAAALAHLHIEDDAEREQMMTHVRKIAAAIPTPARAARLDTTASASEQEWTVGNLLTMSDSDYPGMGSMFAQVWQGEDLIARVYGDTADEVRERAALVARATLAPVAAQQGAAEQHNAVECDSALRAEPASQHHSTVVVLSDDEIDSFAENLGLYDIQDGGRVSAGDLRHFGRVVEAKVATRCRAEGGITSNNEISDLAAKAPAAQADDLRLAICDIPLPVYGSNSFQHGFVSAKEAVLDLLSKRAASPASTPEAAQADVKNFQSYMRSVHPVTNPHPLDVWIAAQRAAHAQQPAAPASTPDASQQAARTLFALKRDSFVSDTGFDIYQAEIEGWRTKQAAAVAAPSKLPKWIDDHKGSDPFMDDVIAYIETLLSNQGDSAMRATQQEGE